MNSNNLEPTIIVVDVGNTTTRLGLCVGEELLEVWQCATRDSLTPDEAQLLLAGFFRSLPKHEMLDGCLPSDGIISCVVPSLTGVWQKALQSKFEQRPLVVGPGLKTGLKMHYNDPAEVGPDRIADVVAARNIYGYPLLVVDMGTSTNIMVVSKDGAFAGGLIAPGLELSARALSQAAARLPVIEIKKPQTVIGKSTRDAMQAGFVLGEVARINGLIKMICNELGYESQIVVTGTEAEAIATLISYPCVVDKDLTLHGLNILYEHNRKKTRLC